MSLWSTLAKLGVAEEIKEESPKTASMPSATPAPQVRAEAPKPLQSVDTSMVAKLDEESRAKLTQSLEAQSFPVIEELNNILEPLQAVIADETVRYNTALSILGKKFDPSKLLEDYDRGLGVLDDTHRQFKAALSDQLEKRVGSKIRNVQKLDSDIQGLQSQILTLSNKLTELQAAREAENSGVAKEQARLDLTQERFDLAHREIRGNLDRERQKVARFGGNIK